MPIFSPVTMMMPQVATGNANFSIVTWTGTGASIAVTGVGFQPDLVWIKCCTAVDDWGVYDSSRGVQKRWRINTTSAQDTNANGLTAFGADGFTVGTQHSSSGQTYIAFCWKEGSAQCDVVNYTGNGSNTRLVNHSLGVTPGFYTSKDVAGAFDTPCNGVALGGTPGTGAYFMSAGIANPANFSSGGSTSSTQFNPAITAYDNNNTSTTCLAYLFGNLAGYSKIGSYTGNGSATGPTVTLGFRARFVLIKLIGTGGWFIVNTVRSPTNTITTSLQLNSTLAEATTAVSVDINANDFQIKSATLLNTNLSSYFYMAFA